MSEVIQGNPPTLGETLARRSAAFENDCRVIADAIQDQASYHIADKKISEATALLKGIEDHHAPVKKAAHQAWKLKCEEENLMKAGVLAGKKHLARAMGAFQANYERQERERREAEEERLRDEARLEAFKLAEQGLPQEVVDSVAEIASEPVQITKSEPLRGKTSFTVDYEIEFVDGEEDKIPLEILIPTTKKHKEAVLAKAKQVAKMTGGKPIPGLKVIQTQSARTRSL